MQGRGLFLLLYKVDASRQGSHSVFYSLSDKTQANMVPKKVITKQTTSAASVVASSATATKRCRDNSADGTNHPCSTNCNTPKKISDLLLIVTG